MHPRDTYRLIYYVAMYDNIHLGADKASRVANICAVKSTNYVHHRPIIRERYLRALLNYTKEKF